MAATMSDQSLSNQSIIRQLSENPITAAGGGGQPGSLFTFDYGTAHVKAYPITDAELSRIGRLRTLASFFLGFASIWAALCGTAICSLYLSTMQQEILLAWKVGTWAAGLARVVCYIFTAILIYSGHTETTDIKSRTRF